MFFEKTKRHGKMKELSKKGYFTQRTQRIQRDKEYSRLILKYLRCNLRLLRSLRMNFSLAKQK